MPLTQHANTFGNEADGSLTRTVDVTDERRRTGKGRLKMQDMKMCMHNITGWKLREKLPMEHRRNVLGNATVKNHNASCE